MLKDLIQKIIVVLSLEYLVFFSAEVVLPGVVASVFNINILLMVVLLLICTLIVLGNNGGGRDDNRMGLKMGNKGVLLLGMFLLLVNIVALYKVSMIMILVYTFVVVVSIKLLWNNQ